MLIPGIQSTFTGTRRHRGLSRLGDRHVVHMQFDTNGNGLSSKMHFPDPDYFPRLSGRPESALLTLLKYPPATAPSMVVGSMTRIRFQSMSGLSRWACLLLTLNRKLEMEPPTMVMFDKATARLVGNPASMGWNNRIIN